MTKYSRGISFLDKIFYLCPEVNLTERHSNRAMNEEKRDKPLQGRERGIKVYELTEAGPATEITITRKVPTWHQLPVSIHIYFTWASNTSQKLT